MKSGDFKMAPKDWDTAAETYARLREPLTLPYGLDTLAALSLMPGERLLDLATGTGGVALAAARRGVEVVAVDWSSGMVSYVDSRVKSEGVDGVTARVMDGQHLDLPANHFHAACSVFGLMFFPNHRAGLAELLRVLKPGGRVGIAVWQPPSQMKHLAIWEQAARACYPEASDFPRPAAWLQMDSAEGLLRELNEAGFRDITVTSIAHDWQVPSVRWLMENADASQSLAEYLGPGSRERIRGYVCTQLQNDYGDRQFALTAHANIAIAFK